MLSFSPHVRVYLASQRVDMRCGHDGLFAIVKSWDLDPFSGHLFAFIGKKADRAKILVWHRGGFLYPQGRARAGCWSHLRRRVFEARATSAPADTDRALALIRDLFRVEHDATEQKIVRSPAHLALRTTRSKPLVEEFFRWAEAKKQEVLPKSPLGEALGYALNQRARLELFLTDARIPMHNNTSEARLRVIAETVSLCTPSSSARNHERAIVMRIATRASRTLAAES